MPPIPYRRQNGSDYLIPSMQLWPELADAGAEGFKLRLSRGSVHVAPKVRSSYSSTVSRRGFSAHSPSR